MNRAFVLVFTTAFLIAFSPEALPAHDNNLLVAFGIEKLAYETGPGSFLAPHEDIFVLDSSDSKPRHLATGIAAVWSPDGRKIAFCAHEGWGTQHITLGQMQLINADGSGHKQITNLAGGACPVDWSPDGGRISFSGSPGGVLLLGEDGETVTRILHTASGLWSPDGTKLAFWKYRGSHEGTGAIWVANADGSNAKKVIDDNSEIVRMCWTPDGEGLLFSSHRGNTGRAEIFRVKLDGSGLETFATDKRLSFYAPLFAPDGKNLVLGANRGPDDNEIIVIELGTKKRTVLARGGLPRVVWARR